MKTRMKKCKNCAEQFTPLRFNQKYCFNVDCIRVWVDIEKAKKWAKDKREKKAELMTVTDWVKIAQTAFNAYIRERDKDKGCISCNAKAGTYTITAGHYFPSTNKAVTYNEDNLHGQCWFNCNSSKSGNLTEYRFGLLERIGEERLNILESEARKTRKFTIEELKEITSTYKAKLKDLKNN
jgi:hypothetical protein